jgi:CubicO group peptidase (beta-lactamase class C family)
LGAGPALILARPAIAQAGGGVPGFDGYVTGAAPTALLVLRKGTLVASYGDVARKVSVASVRKSLLGMLYGIAVQEGRIRLDSTLAELGIDDRPPSLTDTEKRATVEHLLGARSGIYHPAAYETRDMREKRPGRGSHAPGSFWFYNNWDFNVLGTIYRRLTGEDIFESFARRIANPIGMADFATRDGRYVSDPRSEHAAYVFSLSTRDMLRFGQLVAAGGEWQGRRIVPEAWIASSLTSHSRTDRGDLGYGYLWWVLNPAVFGPGAGFASGYGGQFIAAVPSHALVVAQTTAHAPAGGGATRRFVGFLRELVVN